MLDRTDGGNLKASYLLPLAPIDGVVDRAVLSCRPEPRDVIQGPKRRHSLGSGAEQSLTRSS